MVHWRDEARLAELIAAWPRDDPRFELVVVDNSASGCAALAAVPPEHRNPAGDLAAAPPKRRDPDGDPAALPPTFRLLQPGRNLGFAGGVNAGVAASRAPLLLLLNPDAVPAPGALERLVEGFAAHPEAAGLAPQLTGAAGEPQFAWQLRRLPSAWGCLRQTLPWPGAGAGTGPAAEPPAGALVEQPAAAALALRREALLAAGGLDERFHPAWFEDVDLARRLRLAGSTLLYWPQAQFRHALGSTVPRLGYGRFLWIYHRNLERYLAKHHGTAWALAARASLAAGLAIRFPLLAVRRPRRAASRREAAAGLLLAMAGALTGWRLPRRLADDPRGGTAPFTPVSKDTAPFTPVSKDRPAPPPPRPPTPGAINPAGSSMRAEVAVCLVTHDSAPDLAGCMAAISGLLHPPAEIALVDSGSQDGSLEQARRTAPAGIPLTAIGHAANIGFAAGMNAAIAATRAPFVLTLNADALPAPDFLDRLLARFAAHPELRVAAVTGRLVRPAAVHGHGCEGCRADGPRLLDACGMRLTTAWRHLDRGSGEPDRGQWDRPDRVFGATGAASLFRREALLDAAVDGEVFDPRFHSFREDAELCFRLRERGWEILYEPAAVAEHRRFNVPERRAAMPAGVNLHSLKNRYLLRIYHQTARNLARTLVPTLGRDLGALAWVLLRERSSLGAYGWLLRHRAELLARRRAIQGRRTRPAADLDAWFGRQGVSLMPPPAGPPLSPAAPPLRGPAVALIGSRGIPARYGGYETLMEELSVRLQARGFRVTVYCRSHSTPKRLRTYRGVELVVLPTVRTKHLDTPVHTLLACLHAGARGFDAALLVNSANALFLPLLAAGGIPTALHVDGIERRRRKWGPLGRAVYALSERLACILPDALITDAEVIRRHYLEIYGADSTAIAYGVDPRPAAVGAATGPEAGAATPEAASALARLGLRERGYFLYVSRFEPENNPHQVAAAYRAVRGDLPLVMVGGAPYAGDYIAGFTRGADPRILFPGPIYGEQYRELLANALAYVHATEVGGTHPALVEAMGYGNCVVVNDTPENREVAGSAGLYFRAAEPETLTARLEQVRRRPRRARLAGRVAARRAARRYSWERVADQYAQLLGTLAGRR
ncbi:MAG TPA: glycosyltransferase [Thermoanaerobaculia bacterium]|nr:glycosyltransferase [Thermoanaerobaculia bacterium]